MMESKRVEAERARKADATMAALMAVILGNQEESVKGRELETRQAEILEALIRERAGPAEAEVPATLAGRSRAKRAVGSGAELN